MRTLFVAMAALICMCITAPAFALTQDEIYANQIRGTIAEKIGQIKEAKENFIAACKDLSDPGKSVCEDYYRVIATRRIAELAELELMIAALAADPAVRVKIHTEVVPYRIYNDRKDDTNRISEIAKKLYPPQKKSASK